MSRRAGTKTALDERQRVAFELDGNRLRVDFLSGFRPETEELEKTLVAVWAFYCQPRDLSQPSAHATLPFRADTRDLVVELSHDVSSDVGYCYLEPAGAAAEAVGWFVPEEEVFPGQIVTDDPEENERRARAATDCTRFTAQAGSEGAWPGPGQLLAPGTAPTVEVRAYWLGRTLDGHRAIVGHASVETDWDDRGGPVALPQYAAFYEAPEDGCLSSLLPSPEGVELGFDPSRELYVLSMPANSPLAQSYLNDPYALGEAERYGARLRNGEKVTVFPSSAVGLAVLTPTTFVHFQGNGGTVPEPRRLLELLRPLEN